MRCQLAIWVAGGGRISQWYKEHNVSRTTAYNWYKTAAFKRMVAECRRRAVDRAIGRMAKSLSKAVEKIIQLIEEGQTDGVKLSAARTLVDKLIAVQNHAELKADLERLNRRLEVQEERRARGPAANRKPDR